MLKKNTFFNPKDKRKTRREILTQYTKEHIINQKQQLRFYKTKPNQYLIHDKDGNYKTVSKTYYFYHIQEDEYDTETELVDEDDYAEEQRIKNKYNLSK